MYRGFIYFYYIFIWWHIPTPSIPFLRLCVWWPPRPLGCFAVASEVPKKTGRFWGCKHMFKTSLKRTVCPWKWIVGRWNSFWDDLCSRTLLVSGSVDSMNWSDERSFFIDAYSSKAQIRPFLFWFTVCQSFSKVAKEDDPCLSSYSRDRRLEKPPWWYVIRLAMIITQQFQPQPACSTFWFVFATTACLFPLTTQCWQSFHPDSIHQNQPLLPKAAAKDLAPHLVLSWGVFICQGKNRNWKCFNDEDVKRCL